MERKISKEILKGKTRLNCKSVRPLPHNEKETRWFFYLYRRFVSDRRKCDWEANSLYWYWATVNVIPASLFLVVLQIYLCVLVQQIPKTLARLCLKSLPSVSSSSHLSLFLLCSMNLIWAKMHVWDCEANK